MSRVRERYQARPRWTVLGNKFDDLPLDWGVRPFELATLRLQTLKDVQLAHYDDLKPADDRCLTQLGVSRL